MSTETEQDEVELHLEEVRAYIWLTEGCGKGSAPAARIALDALEARLRSAPPQEAGPSVVDTTMMDHAKDIYCPLCGANPGEPCEEGVGFHVGRHSAYRMLDRRANLEADAPAVDGDRGREAEAAMRRIDRAATDPESSLHDVGEVAHSEAIRMYGPYADADGNRTRHPGPDPQPTDRSGEECRTAKESAWHLALRHEGLSGHPICPLYDDGDQVGYECADPGCAWTHSWRDTPDSEPDGGRTSGVAEIRAERHHQTEKWGRAHDREYHGGKDLAVAAAVMALAYRYDGDLKRVREHVDPLDIPHAGDWINVMAEDHIEDHRRMLAIAGAFCAAELDRIDPQPLDRSGARIEPCPACDATGTFVRDDGSTEECRNCDDGFVRSAPDPDDGEEGGERAKPGPLDPRFRHPLSEQNIRDAVGLIGSDSMAASSERKEEAARALAREILRLRRSTPEEGVLRDVGRAVEGAEIIVCSGCGKEDCGSCPAGTSRRVDADKLRSHVMELVEQWGWTMQPLRDALDPEEE